MSEVALREGWKWLFNATRWHYFGPDGRSLCRRWMTLSMNNVEQGNDNSPDNCKVCRTKLLAREID